jgi:hypothetical protein
VGINFSLYADVFDKLNYYTERNDGYFLQEQAILNVLEQTFPTTHGGNLNVTLHALYRTHLQLQHHSNSIMDKLGESLTYLLTDNFAKHALQQVSFSPMGY